MSACDDIKEGPVIIEREQEHARRMHEFVRCCDMPWPCPICEEEIGDNMDIRNPKGIEREWIKRSLENQRVQCMPDPIKWYDRRVWTVIGWVGVFIMGTLFVIALLGMGDYHD